MTFSLRIHEIFTLTPKNNNNDYHVPRLDFIVLLSSFNVVIFVKLLLHSKLRNIALLATEVCVILRSSIVLTWIRDK
jgi:hypothetical protein